MKVPKFITAGIVLEIYWAFSELSSYKNAYIILLGQFEEKDHLENVGVDG